MPSTRSSKQIGSYNVLGMSRRKSEVMSKTHHNDNCIKENSNSSDTRVKKNYVNGQKPNKNLKIDTNKTFENNMLSSSKVSLFTTNNTTLNVQRKRVNTFVNNPSTMVI
jgi:hypothetical protein